MLQLKRGHTVCLLSVAADGMAGDEGCAQGVSPGSTPLDFEFLTCGPERVSVAWEWKVMRMG